MKGIFKDLTGQRFGRLEVRSRAPNQGIDGKRTAWKVKCDCGTEFNTLKTSLLRGDTKSCGCLRKELTAARLKLKPHQALYNHLCRTAKIAGQELQVTYEEFLTFTKTSHCHYCNANLIWSHGAGAYNLDRKDTSKGYSVENCVACCRRCNYGKSDSFSYEQWKDIGTYMQTKTAFFEINGD